LEIPARIVDADDRKATELALVENLQREDLNPIEEARGYRDLIDRAGLTQEDVAVRVSKSRPAVANALRLLALPEEVIGFVEIGNLPAGGARALLGLSGGDAQLEAARTAIKSNMSVREIEALVRRLNRDSENAEDLPADDKIAVNYIKEAKKKLEGVLGRRVAIRHGKDKGRVELEYYGQDDFNDLFDALSSLGNGGGAKHD
jgi:ParB family chromosome partitioning protein